MEALNIVQIGAVVCAGLLAGIYLAHRTGPYYALQKLSPSSFVQFQQVVHARYVRFMPPLVLAALLTVLAWLVIIRSQWASLEFWLIAASALGNTAVAVLTRAVNVPLNNALMTWDVAAPPDNLRALWAPWDRVNTIRAVVATGVLILETVALSVRAAARG
ncbi:MAG TPA: DUF1772 domain-containing protein [Terriglobales bacterium]|jgi:uncharacterized membrane protein|nr:DUF1772 domain-containing protein [Terriglobales bacterium]